MSIQVERTRQRFENLVEQLEDSAAILTLVDLGVFDLLFKKAQSAEALAQATQTDSFRLSRFLNLASALGFMAKNGDEYALLDGDRDLFDPEQSYRHGNRLQGLKKRLTTFLAADEILRTGVPLEVAGSGGDVSEADRRGFLSYLHHASLDVAAEVASWTQYFSLSRVMDVGSGAGTYLWEVLKAHPQAQGQWVDRKNAIALAQEVATAEGVVDRVNFLGGDFFEDPLGEGYDLIILSNLVHCFDMQANQRLISQLSHSLSPGGRMLIKDFEVDDARTGPLKSLRFGIMMTLVGNDGDTYSQNDVLEMVRPAGLAHEITLGMRTSPHSYGMIFKK